MWFKQCSYNVVHERFLIFKASLTAFTHCYTSNAVVTLIICTLSHLVKFAALVVW